MGYLYEREGYELPAAPEGSTDVYDYTLAIEWGIENDIYDEDTDGEPEDLLIVGVTEDILTRYAAFKSRQLAFEIEGKEDDEIVDDIEVVLGAFLEQMKG